MEGIHAMTIRCRREQPTTAVPELASVPTGPACNSGRYNSGRYNSGRYNSGRYNSVATVES
jgi:hypothetical protein